MTEPPSTRVPLAQLRAAMEAATPGRWFREYGDVVTSGPDPRDVADGYDDPRACRVVRRAPHRGLRDEQAIADAALIVALRNNADALLAAAESTERIRALCDKWEREWGDVLSIAAVRAALPPIESPEEKP